jgi:hypothetical protein
VEFTNSLGKIMGEINPHHPTNKKPHECGAECCRKGKSILVKPSYVSAYTLPLINKDMIVGMDSLI